MSDKQKLNSLSFLRYDAPESSSSNQKRTKSNWFTSNNISIGVKSLAVVLIISLLAVYFSTTSKTDQHLAADKKSSAKRQGKAEAFMRLYLYKRCQKRKIICPNGSRVSYFDSSIFVRVCQNKDECQIMGGTTINAFLDFTIGLKKELKDHTEVEVCTITKSDPHYKPDLDPSKQEYKNCNRLSLKKTNLIKDGYISRFLKWLGFRTNSYWNTYDLIDKDNKFLVIATQEGYEQWLKDHVPAQDEGDAGKKGGEKPKTVLKGKEKEEEAGKGGGAPAAGNDSGKAADGSVGEGETGGATGGAETGKTAGGEGGEAATGGAAGQSSEKSTQPASPAAGAN